MSNTLYGFAKHEFGIANINLLSDTIKIVLCTASYVVNLSTDQALSAIGAGTRLATATLASKTISSTTGNFDAADIAFGNVTGGSVGTQAIIYKSTGVEATSTLIFYINQGSSLPVTTDGGPIGISWDTLGIFGL